MERISKSSTPACPTLFTPLQIHSRELLRLGVWSWVGWMRDHAVSIQGMIENYGASVVVAGANLSYTDECLFHDGDTVDIATTSSVHKKGVLIEGISRFRCKGKEFAQMSIYLRPVIIGDKNSSAAKTSHLLPSIQELFHPDEISEVPYPRQVKQLLPLIRDEGQLLAEGRYPFKLFRYAMDFADQWAFMETSAYVSASREDLVMANSKKHDRLIDGVSRPVMKYHLDLKRPYFLFDLGTVATQAYLWDDRLVFVHSLLSQGHGEEATHAIVIEQMEMERNGHS